MDIGMSDFKFMDGKRVGVLMDTEPEIMLTEWENKNGIHTEHVNVNKSYLCDVFKKEQNVTIINYMTNLRIEKAKELLVHTDMKMYEISVEVGYNDYTYFSQIFKRNTGSTLSEFRKKYARK